MFRIRSIVLPAAALAFTTTCSLAPPPPDPEPTRVQPAADLAAVALGVAIDTEGLAPLWIQHQQPSALATHGVQRLRGGASVVRLQQQVDGVDIHHGELHVMVHADGSLAAISGTVQTSSAGTSFRSTCSTARRAPDRRSPRGPKRPATAS